MKNKDFKNTVKEYSNSELEDILLNIDKEQFQEKYISVKKELEYRRKHKIYVEKQSEPPIFEYADEKKLIRWIHNVSRFSIFSGMIFFSLLTALFWHSNIIESYNLLSVLILYLMYIISLILVLGGTGLQKLNKWSKTLLKVCWITGIYLLIMFLIFHHGNSSITSYLLAFWIIHSVFSFLSLYVLSLSNVTTLFEGKKSINEDYEPVLNPNFTAGLLIILSILHLFLVVSFFFSGILLPFFKLFFIFMLVFMLLLSSLIEKQKDNKNFYIKWSVIFLLAINILLLSQPINSIINSNDNNNTALYLFHQSFLWVEIVSGIIILVSLISKSNLKFKEIFEEK